MIPEFNGVLEIDYFGDVKHIPYRMHYLGGTPHIVITDKYGKSSEFIRYYGGKWKRRYGGEMPKWRPDFMELLSRAFELENDKNMPSHMKRDNR
ncbi:hypothetical protein G5B30_16580 [Sphingobacterium sp. SGG-5]|uniref:hypothetical protein n=1 Tax=Sphingobacterium sp. SGG-5 TaxID=2710881 RepID=UPI0013EA12F7|nr:hypothetical protein [Sphingobacterium sp. SGG-5]NGM63527.1 hypothetical protein [Sphingobacterium sp. SGG-5]